METVKNNEYPNIVPGHDYTSWDNWLEITENHLSERGYKKYTQNRHGEDFTYWKTFRVNAKKAYQVGVRFYDFRKFAHTNVECDRIGVQFDCMHIGISSRIDLNVSKDIPVEEFEDMSRDFYVAMNKYCDKNEN